MSSSPSNRSRTTPSLFVFQSSPNQSILSASSTSSTPFSSPPSSPQAHPFTHTQAHPSAPPPSQPLTRLQQLELLFVREQLASLASKGPQELLKDEERKEERRKETRRERESVEREGGRLLW